MRVAIWHAGHPIADTVAQSLLKGIPNATAIHTDDVGLVDHFECHIGYGILRGMDKVFTRAKQLGLPYFNLDRGYWGASHFGGTYRISLNGTQSVYDETLVPRHSYQIFKPWRTTGDHILICPPTKPVCDFFHIDPVQWLHRARSKCGAARYVIRYKDDQHPLDLTHVRKVITFNSSVGWQALAEGIEVDSDPQHSLVGSYCNKKSIDNIDRDRLFRFMQACQFTLAEIEQGNAWPLINHYLSAST